MQRPALVLVLVLGLTLTSCGGGGSSDPSRSTTAGPALLCLPFVPTATGEVLTLGFKNLSSSAGTVTVTAFMPGGIAYAPGPVAVAVPAHGDTRMPLAGFTGAGALAGGWISVETRNPAVRDPVTGEPTPVATTGFIVPYMKRSMGGFERDASAGGAFRSTGAQVGLTENSISYQVVNASVTPALPASIPVAATFTITVFSATGAVLTSTVTPIGANNSMTFMAPGTVGRVAVEPTGGPPGALLRAFVGGLEEDPQVQVEARVLEAADSGLAQRDVGFDFRFGMDVPGNVHDFQLILANRGTSDAVVELAAILRDDGSSLLPGPRAILVRANATKLVATTTADSRGLEMGEISPFADIFGDVTVATGLETLTVHLRVPSLVDVSGRDLDSVFKSYHRIVPGRKLTNDMAVLGVEVQTVTTGGVRNYVSLMNPLATPVEVFIRGYTPGGTEYILDSVVVAGFNRVDWSPDGMTFREVPTDTTAPPVAAMCFRFSSTGGLLFGARKERRAVTGLYLAVTPHVMRDLRFE